MPPAGDGLRLWDLLPVTCPDPGNSRLKSTKSKRRMANNPGRNVMYQQAIDTVSKQVLIRDRYDNFIGGKWVAPAEGRYFDNPSPVTGKKLCEVPRSSAQDIELALDPAHN